MNRGVITISESGTVSMPTDTVWMTLQEIADMYNVFGCYVRKAVKAVFKDGILNEPGVRRHVRKNDRISYDVYSLELVIAVAFRIDSIESRAFNVPWRLCASSHLGEPPQCFSMVLDFIQTIRRTPGKHDQLGIANKTRRQPITTTLGKLYVVALFISPHSSRTCISPTSPSFCTPHDS